MTHKPETIVLAVDDHHGIYAPQTFAEFYLDGQLDKWHGVNAEDLVILLAGPDNEVYWDTWDSVESYAEREDGYSIHQDGDIWLIKRDQIGDTEDLADAAGYAYNLVRQNAAGSIAAALGSLYGTYGHTQSFEEACDAIRDVIDSACEEAVIPEYIWGDCGLENVDFDLRSAVLDKFHPELRPYIR